MDNIRQQHNETDNDESSNPHDLIAQLERDRGSINTREIQIEIDRHTKQQKKKELHLTTYSTGIVGASVHLQPVIFPLGIHLPDEANIGSTYIENHSGCTFNVFEGPGGGGRIIAIATNATYRVIAIADGISNISLVCDLSKSLGDGLVIVTVFSHNWSPKMGTIV